MRLHPSLKRLAVAAVVALAGCALPSAPPRVAACDEDIARLKFVARAGDPLAQYHLGARYHIAWLNPGMCAVSAEDAAIEAYRWYALAATQGIAAAAHQRDLLAEVMTTSQRAEAERRVAQWLERGD